MGQKEERCRAQPTYTAPSPEAAETALLEFAESDLGRKYPAAVKTWENAWERFIPFPEFPPEVRKIIYTTNSIEPLSVFHLAVLGSGAGEAGRGERRSSW